MLKSQLIQPSNLKLPSIQPRSQLNSHNKTFDQNHYKACKLDSLQRAQDDLLQVSKLNQWSMNCPIKKSRKIHNSHNISFSYKNTHIKKRQPTCKNNKFVDIQLYIAKIDNQLHKIYQVNYGSIFKNMQYCSGVYQNSFNTILKMIKKYQIQVKEYIEQQQKQIEKQRQQHVRKVNQIQEKNNQNYKYKINQVRENLEEKENQLRPMKKILRNLAATRVKVLKYCLALGYDIRQQGLVWILKQLGEIPKIQEFPKFLTEKQIKFIISKYTNEYEVSHCQTKMKNDIFGKTINEAYEFVNRKKRRQLSLIKQNQALTNFYIDKVKDYSPDNHSYLFDKTLDIAQQIEKNKPRPTRYQIIYKQAARKLNKICKEKIHPQIYGKHKNKENKNPQKSEHDLKTVKNFKKQPKQKRRSTLIVEQLAKMLQMSQDQTKKIEDMYTKQEKQLQQILRQIRLEKYTSGNISQKLKFNESKFEAVQDFQVRNPISIIGCLVGWKKAGKIIQQQMFRF